MAEPLGAYVAQPPAPENPPTRDDYVHAIIFQHDLTEAYVSNLISKDRLVEGFVYTSTMTQRLAQGGHFEAPPWFGPAIQAAMQDAMAPLRNDIRRLEKKMAMASNRSRTGGVHDRFDVVYFANLEDPTTHPHNLPPLISRPAIVALTMDQKAAYCAGYFPGRDFDEAEYDTFVYVGIGVMIVVCSCQVCRPFQLTLGLGSRIPIVPTPKRASDKPLDSPPPTMVEDGVIRAGDTVLLRLPTGDIKSCKLEANSTVSLGKFGSFLADALVDQPYGLTYEINNKTVSVIPPRPIEELEDTDATNELINDGQFVQPLTASEIETLKQSGVHASEIIKKQIDMHANYSLKTEYSKDKYKKRKAAKYSKSFTTVQPTLFNVCEYWFAKDQTRILSLRVDTLSQMMNLGNVRPGGRYIVVDDASGMVVSAMLERLGGNGRLITICDVDSPPAYPVMTQMNIAKELTVNVLSSLNWGTADEAYTPIVLSAEPARGSYGSEKHKTRLSKRKTNSDALSSVREELFAGEFEGVFLASAYDPFSILQKLFPYLGGSASVVVYSPHLQVVSDLQATLRVDPQYLAPSVSESWLRRYQVLPGRTHPLMSTSGGGGYLLHAIKIYNDPSAEPVVVHRRSKVAKQTIESSLEQSEDLSTRASCTGADVGIDDK